jgi:hypothetical protein
MSSTSPFETPKRHAQLKLTGQPIDDTIEDLLGVITIPHELKQLFMDAAQTIDEFVVYDKADCEKFVEDLHHSNKTIAHLRDKGHRRFLAAQLYLCVQYRAHGGTFQGSPTLKEMASSVAVAQSPSMLGVATPVAAPTATSKEPAPIDSSKFSDAIAVWDGSLESWFEWKKKLLTKCRQHPEFEKVLLDEAESKKDKRRSDILYGILLEKTEGGQAHTLGKQTKDKEPRAVLKPGDVTSVDQMNSSTPGLVAQISGTPTTKRYKCATVFVDQSTRMGFVYLQVSSSAEETIEAKSAWEAYARTHGITVKAYHADNGIFRAHKWTTRCRDSGQPLTFAGVNSHHENRTHCGQPITVSVSAGCQQTGGPLYCDHEGVMAQE